MTTHVAGRPDPAHRAAVDAALHHRLAAPEAQCAQWLVVQAPHQQSVSAESDEHPERMHVALVHGMCLEIQEGQRPSGNTGGPGRAAGLRLGSTHWAPAFSCGSCPRLSLTIIKTTWIDGTPEQVPEVHFGASAISGLVLPFQRAAFRLARLVEDAIHAAGRTDLHVVPAVNVQISTAWRTALIPDVAVLTTIPVGPSFPTDTLVLAVKIWSPGHPRAEWETKTAGYAAAGTCRRRPCRLAPRRLSQLRRSQLNLGPRRPPAVGSVAPHAIRMEGMSGLVPEVRFGASCAIAPRWLHIGHQGRYGALPNTRTRPWTVDD